MKKEERNSNRKNTGEPLEYLMGIHFCFCNIKDPYR